MSGSSTPVSVGKARSGLKLDFDALPLQGFSENRRDVQIAFDGWFASHSVDDQLKIEQLLTKGTYNKSEKEQVQKMFAQFQYLQYNSLNTEEMEKVVLDPSEVDQQTKQKILKDELNKLVAMEEQATKARQAEENETKRAAAIADLIADFSQNEKGETLANVHTSEGFQEIYDFSGQNLTNNRLDRKKEQVAHNYSAKSHLFQKVYYAKDLLLDDERVLR